PGSRGAQALSTVHQPIQEMGVKAAEAIIEMILTRKWNRRRLYWKPGWFCGKPRGTKPEISL
ncbi:MAG: hypothetical protein RBT34_02500, partial [Anaerolineaceae bacterium]|nr:hypothetical protein [Anaerolineaceae bacterium]